MDEGSYYELLWNQHWDEEDAANTEPRDEWENPEERFGE